MLICLWWKIRDFIEERIYGPAKYPETVKEALAHKKQGWHLITEQEYYQMATGTLPPGTLIGQEVCVLDHLKATGQYDDLPSVQDQKFGEAAIRFDSLCSAERMDRLTNEERIELGNLSTIDMLHPEKPRVMLGMRRANFPL